jgi:hypothetical protein
MPLVYMAWRRSAPRFQNHSDATLRQTLEHSFGVAAEFDLPWSVVFSSGCHATVHAAGRAQLSLPSMADLQPRRRNRLKASLPTGSRSQFAASPCEHLGEMRPAYRASLLP